MFFGPKILTFAMVKDIFGRDRFHCNSRGCSCQALREGAFVGGVCVSRTRTTTGGYID